CFSILPLNSLSVSSRVAVSCLRPLISSCIFFFFQAEDGIRDLYVTGVQTCALPISHDNDGGRRTFRGRCRDRGRHLDRRLDVDRSEERRVGKECRSRGWLWQKRKKRNIMRRWRDIMWRTRERDW